MLFDRFRREAPTLQLYGKLPLAKDYLRVGASRGAARHFREWLDATFSTRSTGDAAPDLAWPARFALGAVSSDPLVGSLWPSSDEGGERRFPFAMFVERRRRPFVEALGGDFAGLTVVWQQLERRFERRGDHRDGAAFLEAMRGQVIDLGAPDADQPAPRIGWDQWTRALWPEDGEQALTTLLSGLRPLGTAPQATIRLPLVGDLPILPQVRCWWTALATLRVFGPDRPPTLLFPQTAADDGAFRFCAFAAGPLTPAHGVWLRGVGDTPLGPGDHCSGPPPAARPGRDAPERGHGLAETMRGLAATVRARS